MLFENSILRLGVASEIGMESGRKFMAKAGHRDGGPQH